ncbi:MAG: cytochrome c [Alphaproteobacteria bacterium]|nr:cytochrome c [Alphaproteobacteria bacterium]
MLRWVLCAAAVALVLGGCLDDGSPLIQSGRPDSEEGAALIEDGRLVAEKNCAQCHAIGKAGASPMPSAPVFRSLLRRYNADVLETELSLGMRVAHGPMPEFQFKPEAVSALIAYMRSIQTRDPSVALIEQRCARCHAVAATDTSPYPGAQPFRALGRRWSRDQLRAALRVGILAEHDQAEARVPPMKLTSREIDLLFSYLDSIATAEDPSPQ